jgi:hypothetical protein
VCGVGVHGQQQARQGGGAEPVQVHLRTR